MVRKQFIIALLLSVLICSPILIYPSGVLANGNTDTFQIAPPSEWDAWRPTRNTVLAFTANIIETTTQFTLLFFMFAALPFAQATNVSIEPLIKSTY